MRCSENLSFRRFPMDQVRIVRRWARPARSCRRPVSSSRDSKRVTPQGEPISVEFLIDEPSFQPHHMPFIKNLGTLGIEATLRVVDPVQYRKRVDDFDFDLTIQLLRRREQVTSVRVGSGPIKPLPELRELASKQILLAQCPQFAHKRAHY